MDHFPGLIILFLVVIGTVNSSICPNLLKSCTCGQIEYDFRIQYVVNCTNTGFHTTNALETLPEETQVLIFTGNTIPELPWNVFGVLSKLEKLRVIDMSNNGIRDIRGKSYHHVTNVERLILNHNNLSISSADVNGDYHHPRVFSNFINLLELHLTNAFQDNTNEALANDLHDIFVNSNLTQLKKLHLEQNEIRSFGDRAVFCDLPNLRDLHLGSNILTEINFDLLCLKYIRFLDLQRNTFTTFDTDILNLWDRLAPPFRNQSFHIDVSSNPLVCDRLVQFRRWLDTTQVHVRNKELLTCHETGGTGNGVAFVTQTAPEPSSSLATVILSIPLVVVIGSLIFIYRRHMLQGQQIFHRFNRNVQYTSIEPQPEHV